MFGTAEVREIRKRHKSGETIAYLAENYQVATTTISKVVNRLGAYAN